MSHILQKAAAPVSYNFYQVSPLLRLIIYYFWEVFKILPNIYSTPALCRLSFLHLFDHNNNNNNQNKSKQACASIVAIVFSAYLLPASASIRTVRACALGIYASAHKRSVLISSAFLSGKAVHFFFDIVFVNLALFCLKFGTKLAANCPKRPKNIFGNAWCRE